MDQKVGFAFDDGGRKAAGYKGSAGDCVVRAMAILTGIDYQQCYDELAEGNSKQTRVRASDRGKRSARNGVYRTAFAPVFKQHGLEKVKLPKGPRPTITEAHAQYGNCIISTRKHLFAIIDGAVRDTWDCRLAHRKMVLCPYCADKEGFTDDDVIGSRKSAGLCDDCGDWLGGYAPRYVAKSERKAMSIWILPGGPQGGYEWEEADEDHIELQLSDTISITVYRPLPELRDNWYWTVQEFKGSWQDVEWGVVSSKGEAIRMSESWAAANKEVWQ